MLIGILRMKVRGHQLLEKTSQTVTRTAQAAMTAYEESLPQHVDLWLLETFTYF